MAESIQYKLSKIGYIALKFVQAVGSLADWFSLVFYFISGLVNFRFFILFIFSGLVLGVVAVFAAIKDNQDYEKFWSALFLLEKPTATVDEGTAAFVVVVREFLSFLYNHILEPFLMISNTLLVLAYTLVLFLGLTPTFTLFATVSLFIFVLSLSFAVLIHLYEERVKRGESLPQFMSVLYYFIQMSKAVCEVFGILLFISFMFISPYVFFHASMAFAIVLGLSLVFGFLYLLAKLYGNDSCGAMENLKNYQDALSPSSSSQSLDLQDALSPSPSPQPLDLQDALSPSQSSGLLLLADNQPLSLKDKIGRVLTITELTTREKDKSSLVRYFVKEVYQKYLSPFLENGLACFAIFWTVIFFGGVTISAALAAFALLFSAVVGVVGVFVSITYKEAIGQHGAETIVEYVKSSIILNKDDKSLIDTTQEMGEMDMPPPLKPQGQSPTSSESIGTDNSGNLNLI